MRTINGALLTLQAQKEPSRRVRRIVRYCLNVSHDRAVLQTFICRYAETPDELDISPYVENEKLFAIRLKDTGRLIGIILYFDEEDGSCEIGYGLGSSFWGRGYATEAAERFIEYLFDEFAITKEQYDGIRKSYKGKS